MRSKIRFIIIVTIISLVLLWIIGLTSSPKIEVNLVDVKITQPDNRWELKGTGDLMQIEFIFEFANVYSKNVPLIGVYSPRLEKSAMEFQGVNYDFHRNLAPNDTDRFSIYYLVENASILEQIDIEKDFIAYASFTMIIIAESAEKTWRGTKFFAPFFKVSLLNVKNKWLYN